MPRDINLSLLAHWAENGEERLEAPKLLIRKHSILNALGRKQPEQGTEEYYTVRIRESETTIKIKFALFRGGGVGRGAGREIVQNAIFHGKRHDNNILKVKILLSKKFVVMAQAPIEGGVFLECLEALNCLENCKSNIDACVSL